MKKQNPETANSWIKAINALSNRDKDVVPDGWRTIAQIAKDTNRSDSRTRECINELIALKKVEYKKFRVASGLRSPYPTWHYYLNDKDL